MLSKIQLYTYLLTCLSTCLFIRLIKLIYVGMLMQLYTLCVIMYVLVFYASVCAHAFCIYTWICLCVFVCVCVCMCIVCMLTCKGNYCHFRGELQRQQEPFEYGPYSNTHARTHAHTHTHAITHPCKYLLTNAHTCAVRESLDKVCARWLSTR